MGSDNVTAHQNTVQQFGNLKKKMRNISEIKRDENLDVARIVYI